MAVLRMDHVGVVVEDLEAATEFFLALGLERDGEGSVEGGWVDRVVGLEGVRSDLVFLQAPDGNGRLELTRFRSPPGEGEGKEEAANAPGIRHLSFAVDEIDATVERLRSHGGELVGQIENYDDVYRLCYLRGPERIIVELAERID